MGVVVMLLVLMMELPLLLLLLLLLLFALGGPLYSWNLITLFFVKLLGFCFLILFTFVDTLLLFWLELDLAVVTVGGLDTGVAEKL